METASSENSEKQEKGGMFSALFSTSAGNRKKLPLLLLLCGAVGAVLLLLGGELSGGGNTVKDTAESEAISKAAKAELSELLSGIEGAGETKIYVTVTSGADRTEKLQGIAVLCEGGNDPLVQKRIIGLLSALYNLGTHRIYVGGLESSGADIRSGS